MPSPTCTVNGSAPPVDVTASSTITIALANAAGVNSWFLTCLGTDETTSAATLNGTLAVNSNAKTATATVGGLGTASIWQSTVGVGSASKQGAGCDANNAVQASYTTTFKVNVKAANGNRVLVVNEVLEQDSTFGWISAVNASLRTNSGTSLLGDVTGTSSASVVSGISGASPIAITPSTLQWALGTASPQITQSTQVSNAAPANLTIAPQAPNAGATNATNGTPGTLIVSLASPVNGGSHAGFVVQESGTNVSTTGIIRLANSTIISARNQANSGDIPLIQTDGSNNVIVGTSGNSTGLYLDANATVNLRPGGNNVFSLGSGGAQFKSVSVAITTGTQALTSAQYVFPYIILTGSLSGSVTLQFPAVVGGTWFVDATAVTLNGHTITLQANSNNWGTSVGTTNIYQVTYGGTGKLYGTALAP